MEAQDRSWLGFRTYIQPAFTRYRHTWPFDFAPRVISFAVLAWLSWKDADRILSLYAIVLGVLSIFDKLYDFAAGFWDGSHATRLAYEMRRRDT